MASPVAISLVVALCNNPTTSTIISSCGFLVAALLRTCAETENLQR